MTVFAKTLKKEIVPIKKVTSIGNSVHTRYSSKNDKRMKKQYKGQG